MAARHLLIVLLFLACARTGAAQDALQNRTPNTFTASADVPSPRATVQDLTWLAGRWTGAGLGGVCEEAWSDPEGGAMMGMFRLVRDGKVVFYEFLTLVEHGGSLLLKLKHFNPDLTGWEEKADFVKFRLLKTSPDAIHFDGLTFKRAGNDRLEIFLAIHNRSDGTVREERFEMGRTPSRSQ
jgi:Domain of unknown function (DUF6265)